MLTISVSTALQQTVTKYYKSYKESRKKQPNV